MSAHGEHVRKAILRVIRAYPAISTHALAAEVGKGVTTVKYHLEWMVARGALRREECSKCGSDHWRIR